MPLRFETVRAEDMTARDWGRIDAVRASQPAYASPFYDPLYTRAAARAQSGIAVGFARLRGETVAAWPLQLRSQGWSRPVGAPFSDWDGPVVAAGHDLEPADFLRGLGRTGHSGSNFAAPVRTGHAHRIETASAISEIGDDGAAFLAACAAAHPRQFKKLRRLERRLHASHEVRFAVNRAGEADFERLIALKRAQLRASGLHDVLGQRWVRHFLDALRAAPTADFGPAFATLHLDGELAAAEFNLRSGPVMHGWIAAYDPRFAALSPGHMLSLQLMQHLPAIGVTRYDAGSSEHDYKRFYANAEARGWSATIETGPTRRPERIAARMTRYLEQHAPSPAAGLLTRSRRRFDQICATELTPLHRALGAAAALRRIARPGA